MMMAELVDKEGALLRRGDYGELVAAMRGRATWPV